MNSYSQLYSLLYSVYRPLEMSHSWKSAIHIDSYLTYRSTLAAGLDKVTTQLHSRHKHAPFDCLIPNNFLRLMSYKKVSVRYIFNSLSWSKVGLQHTVWQPFGIPATSSFHHHVSLCLGGPFVIPHMSCDVITLVKSVTHNVVTFWTVCI